MRLVRGSVLVLGLFFGFTVGVPVALSSVEAPVATAMLTVLVQDAAAQLEITGDCNLAVVCDTSTSASGDAGDATGTGGSGESGGDGGDGGNGGRGGFATVHDVGNAHADASSSVVIDDIATGDAIAHQVNVDARGAARPVVVVAAGSFADSGVDIFAPGGNAQAGTTGGYGLSADASGGDAGDGGDGGDGGNGGDAATAGGSSGDSSAGGGGGSPVSAIGGSGAASGNLVLAPVISTTVVSGP